MRTPGEVEARVDKIRERLQTGGLSGEERDKLYAEYAALRWALDMPPRARTATTVVVTFTDLDPVTAGDLVQIVLTDAGAKLIPCRWAPDPDTIADACGVARVQVVDLNPTR